jgi:hypothetical protein
MANGSGKLFAGLPDRTERMARSELRLTAVALLVMLVCGMIALGADESRAESLIQASALNGPDALLKLAQEQPEFTKLTECDQKLLKSAQAGDYSDCRSSNDKENDPSKGDQWPESRQISAKLIRWLCVNEAARELIDPEGIEVYGAVIREPLDLEFISVPFEIDIEQSRILGTVTLTNADVAALYLMGTWTGPIDASGLKTRDDVFLRGGFHADGGVSLMGATVGGNLECDGGTFSNPNAKAIDADGIKVAGYIFLRNGFKATGEVDLLGATVGRNLEGDSGTFSNPNQKAIDADGVKVAGYIFLRNGFKATGEVDLLGATVGRNLECMNGTFNNPSGIALFANSINVVGAVFLNQGFNAKGEVNLIGATIGGDLDCVGATFTSGSALIAQRAQVSGEFWWTSVTDGSKGANADQKAPDVQLDLVGASAGSLADDEKSWPPYGNLFLNGFTYKRLELTTNTGAEVPRDADSRLIWLRRQDHRRGPATEPYEQLAKVLESGGDEQGARQVRIAMEDDLLPFLPWYTRLWRRILKYTVAYGYEPWLALYWAAGFVIFGSLLFAFGYRAGVIGPTDNDASSKFQYDRTVRPGYQPFNAFVYSLDTFLPIITLGLKDRWMPNPNLKPREWHFINWGGALRWYFWVHLLLGWVLITLFVAGFTGIIRR